MRAKRSGILREFPFSQVMRLRAGRRRHHCFLPSYSQYHYHPGGKQEHRLAEHPAVIESLIVPPDSEGWLTWTAPVMSARTRHTTASTATVSPIGVAPGVTPAALAFRIRGPQFPPGLSFAASPVMEFGEHLSISAHVDLRRSSGEQMERVQRRVRLATGLPHERR